MLDNHVDDIGGSFVSHIPVDEMLSHRTALQCSIICAKAAMALIGVIYRNLATPAPWGEKPAWLFSVLRKYFFASMTYLKYPTTMQEWHRNMVAINEHIADQ